MPTPSITLWVNSTSNRLMSSFDAVSSNLNTAFKQGDTIGVEVHVLAEDNDGINEYQLPLSGGISLALGLVDTAPLSGDFKLSYNSEATASLPFNATASQLQIALNALSSVTALGGVAVIKNGTIYRIIWNQQCVIPYDIVVNKNSLYPSSTIALNIITAGSVSQNQSQQVHIKQMPVANITSFVDQDSAEAQIELIKDASFSGDTKIWRLDIKVRPKGGSFVISFKDGINEYSTGQIPVDSSASDIMDALNEKFVAGWSVYKNASYSWDISTSRYSILDFTVDDSSVISYSSKYGILNLNTIQVEELLSGDASASAIMEIELESDGSKKTLYQGTCTILNDLIDSDVYSIVQWGDYIPADAVVRYDTSQSLTSLEKAQARSNIGAIDSTDIASLQSKDLELEGRLAGIESTTLDADKIASINANGTLLSTNPVVSDSQLTTALTGYASIIHYHAISDITSLQNILNNKSDSSHTHDYSAITGLANALSLKLSIENAALLYSLTGHTHTAFGNLLVSDLGCVGLTASTISCSGSITAPESEFAGLKVKPPYPSSSSDSLAEVYGQLNVYGPDPYNGMGGLIQCKVLKVESIEFMSGSTLGGDYGSFISSNVNTQTYNNYIKEIVIQFGPSGQKYAIPAREVF